MARLLTFLRQPYPVPDGPGAQLRRALLIGGFVGGFLVLFQPFELGQWATAHKTLKVAGFGAVSALVTGAWYGGWLALAPGFFRENRWTVGRAALFLNANIALIALANLVYLSWAADVPLAQLRPGWMLAVTFLLGAFPAAGVTAATYVRELRRFRAAAAALPARSVPPPPPTAPAEGLPAQVLPAQVLPAGMPAEPVASALTFTADNGKDTLTLPLAAVRYLEAADNYCTIWHVPAPDQPLARGLLRASLSRLAAQAAAQAPGQFTRVHRSYLVGLAQVTRVSGNAQGYRLHLPGAEPVPVGRTYAEGVLAALQALPARP